MVVFSAVEERDLRSRNSDACSVRLGRWTATVMCMGRGPEAGQSAANACFLVQAGRTQAVVVMVVFRGSEGTRARAGDANGRWWARRGLGQVGDAMGGVSVDVQR